jgi:hypothetical protein
LLFHFLSVLLSLVVETIEKANGGEIKKVEKGSIE